MKPSAASSGLVIGATKSPTVEAERDQVFPRRHLAVDADLDVLPVGGLGVDLVTEGVTAGLERHHRAGDECVGVVAEDAYPGARREPGREGSDRNQLEAAVVLEPAHHAADGVGVNHQCTVRFSDSPGSSAMSAPRRVNEKGTPKSLKMSPINCITASVRPDGLGSAATPAACRSSTRGRTRA